MNILFVIDNDNENCYHLIIITKDIFMQNLKLSTLALSLWVISNNAMADESLLGYIKGAETLPKGSIELDQTFTYRNDKGAGDYSAWDSKTELEYGVTDRFTAAGYLKMQSINMRGLVVDGYLPGNENYGLRPSGVEASFKYMFLSPAKDDFGLAGYLSLGYDWLDKNSGQGKDKYSIELKMLAQKYFMEGQMVWAANIGTEAAYAKRDKLSASRQASLPADFDWPAEAEMEIELMAGTGLSYRFAPGWFVGAETLYETEFETGVGQERWSLFAGPSLHYANKQWWATVTWFHQLKGGGEQFSAQNDNNLHLIEKTKEEIRIKFGYEF